jgi:hypothetical protein
MVTVTIGSDSRSLQDADPRWVTQAVRGRRKDGQSVCVRVRIQQPGADVALHTLNCGSGFGGGRAPNAREQQILMLLGATSSQHRGIRPRATLWHCGTRAPHLKRPVPLEAASGRFAGS